MSDRRATAVRGAGVPEPVRPMLVVLTTDTPVQVTETVDVDLLRTIGWGQSRPMGRPTSIAIARLRRAGLVERAAGGSLQLTAAGLDLLDDDF